MHNAVEDERSLLPWFAWSPVKTFAGARKAWLRTVQRRRWAADLLGALSRLRMGLPTALVTLAEPPVEHQADLQRLRTDFLYFAKQVR